MRRRGPGMLPIDQPQIHVNGEGPRPEPGQQPQPGPGSHCPKPAVTFPVPSQEPCTSLIRIKEKTAFGVERFVPLICKKNGQCNKPQGTLPPPPPTERPPRRGNCRWQQAPQDSLLVAEERVADRQPFVWSPSSEWVCSRRSQPSACGSKSGVSTSIWPPAQSLS